MPLPRANFDGDERAVGSGDQPAAVSRPSLGPHLGRAETSLALAVAVDQVDPVWPRDGDRPSVGRDPRREAAGQTVSVTAVGVGNPDRCPHWRGDADEGQMALVRGLAAAGSRRAWWCGM